MIVINTLANVLPINGRGTGQISDSYSNLFAPAGITFIIWGIIYFLLLLYTIYQLSFYGKIPDERKNIFVTVGLLFSISSIANAIWIFAWHYDILWLSVLLMLVILICLICINLFLRKKTFTIFEKCFLVIPFTVYLGWITVATIANITTFLVAIKWNQFMLSDVFWTNTILLVGAIIGTYGIFYYRSIAYGAVIFWAYIGIAIKHISVNGFNSQYASIIVTVFVSLLLIFAGELLYIQIRIKSKNAPECELIKEPEEKEKEEDKE